MLSLSYKDLFLRNYNKSFRIGIYYKKFINVL